MALTRITKGVIKPNENYDTHNINSTGIVTAIGLDINGSGDISGDLSVGGVLTYEDVTSIDSVGLITARNGIHVGAGVSAVGVGTFGGIKVGTGVTIETNGNSNFVGVSSLGTGDTGAVYLYNPDADALSGTTNDIYGWKAKTYTSGLQVNSALYLSRSGSNGLSLSYNNATGSYITANSGFLRMGVPYGGYFNIYSNQIYLKDRLQTTTFALFEKVSNTLWKSSLYSQNQVKLSIEPSGVNVVGTTTSTQLAVTGVSTFTGNIDANGDLDVDGHTNLDNVSIAGVTTTTGSVTVGGELNLIGGSDAAKYIDARTGNNSLIFRSTSGGDSNHVTMFSVSRNGASFVGNLNVNKDLDVDGHTNLDNVSIAGVSTVSTFLQVLGSGGTSDKGLEVRSNSTQNTDSNKAIRVRNNSTTDTFNLSYKGRGYFAGDVLIGTQSAAGKLTVDTGANGTAGYICVTSAGGGRLRLGYAYNGGPSNDQFAEILTDTNGDLDIATRGNNSSQIKLFTSTGSGPEERLRIDSSGKIGIGQNNPATTLEIKSDANAQTTATIPTLRITNDDGSASANDITGSVEFFTEDSSDPNHISGFMRNISETNAGVNFSLVFGTKSSNIAGDATEKLRIDSSGRLLIGHSSVTNISAHTPRVQIQGTDFSTQTLSVVSNTADANPAYLFLSKQRSGAAGGNTIVQNNDRIGEIRFNGNDGVDFACETALIASEVDGAPGADDMPGRLVFYTTSDGQPSPTERVRIDSTGDVRFAGTNLTNNTNKSVNLTAPSYNTSEEDVNLVQVENEVASNQISFGGGTSGLNAATTLRFLTASAVNTTTGTERLRITSTGAIKLNDNNIEPTGAGGNVTTAYDNAGWEKLVFDASYNQNPIGPNKIILQNDSGGSGWYAGFGIATNELSIYSGGNTVFYRGFNNASAINESLRINSNGHLSLGGSNVTDVNMITINGSGASSNIGIVFNKTNSPARAYGVNVHNGTGDFILFDYTANTERLRITSNGQTRFGDESSSDRTGYRHQFSSSANSGDVLSLQNPTNSDGQAINLAFYARNTNNAAIEVAKIKGVVDESQANSTQAGSLRFLTNKGASMGERMQINTSGNVRITGATHSNQGSHAGNVPLQIVGGGNNTITMFLGNGDTSANGVNDYSSNIRFNGAAVAWGDISYYPTGNSNGGAFRFTGNGSTVTSQGNRSIGCSGIFINGTAQAQHLDDYEEGTHSTTDSSGASLSISGSMSYTKIGRLVHCLFDITYPSTSNGSVSSISIPFAYAGNYGSGVIGWTNKQKPTFVHINSNGINFMDNDGGNIHYTNDELSTKRFIGATTYFTNA